MGCRWCVVIVVRRLPSLSRNPRHHFSGEENVCPQQTTENPYAACVSVALAKPEMASWLQTAREEEERIASFFPTFLPSSLPSQATAAEETHFLSSRGPGYEQQYATYIDAK